MSDESRIDRWVIPTAIATVWVAMALCGYLLWPRQQHPHGDEELRALRSQLEEANRRIEMLEHLPSSKAPPDAYQQDLKQHELLLSELRSQRSEVEDRIKRASEVLAEVKETEDRTRAAATLFLGIFGAIATFLLGQSYWQFRGWKEEADKSLDKIKSVEPAIDLIKATRATLETKLPNYIKETQSDLVQVKFPKGPALAKMREIDHLAYLSNTEMRFKEKRTEKETKEYAQALLEAARGHLLQQNYYEAEDRLQEYFRNVAQHPDKVEPRDKAKAHSYRAYIYQRLMVQIVSSPSWTRNLKDRNEDDFRQTAFAEVKESLKCDKDWWHAYFVEAMLYSQHYVPEHVLDPQKTMFLEGQQKAIAIYQQLTNRGAGCSPGMGSWQNLACCLKRVADTTGEEADYDLFKDELTKFPDDKQILQGYTQHGRHMSEEAFLWQAMLQDGELFAKVDKINANVYRLFWEDLLTKKVTLRDWKKDLQEMKTRAAQKMAGWLI